MRRQASSPTAARATPTRRPRRSCSTAGACSSCKQVLAAQHAPMQHTAASCRACTPEIWTAVLCMHARAMDACQGSGGRALKGIVTCVVHAHCCVALRPVHGRRRLAALADPNFSARLQLPRLRRSAAMHTAAAATALPRRRLGRINGQALVVQESCGWCGADRIDGCCPKIPWELLPCRRMTTKSASQRSRCNEGTQCLWVVKGKYDDLNFKLHCTDR